MPKIIIETKGEEVTIAIETAGVVSVNGTKIVQPALPLPPVEREKPLSEGQLKVLAYNGVSAEQAAAMPLKEAKALVGKYLEEYRQAKSLFPKKQAKKKRATVYAPDKRRPQYP
jgi:hypothetical protein